MKFMIFASIFWAIVTGFSGCKSEVTGKCEWYFERLEPLENGTEVVVASKGKGELILPQGDGTGLTESECRSTCARNLDFTIACGGNKEWILQDVCLFQGALISQSHIYCKTLIR
jgi:hypothetical protein